MAKKRKPMTEEQRKAAAERLAYARSMKKPPQYKNIHPNVLTIPEDNEFSVQNVKMYIKKYKQKITQLRKSVRLKERGAEAKLASAIAYRRHCEQYLKDGIWSLDFIGEDEERKVVWGCIAPAYDKDGLQKVPYGRC